MAIRGPKPKPTAIKILEGNPGKRPLNNKEPQPKQGIPECPEWLEPEAKKVWERLAIELAQMGTLTTVDREVFASFCQSYARWKEAEEFLTLHGTIMRTQSGYIQQLPQVSIAQTYMKRMNESGSLLGLNASARSRIIVDAKKSIVHDEMEDILNV